MHRFLFISLALVCLLAGCSAPQASDPAPDASNDLDAYFEEKPADNEVGSAEFGLQDPMDMVYTYDGEPLEIPFSITGASSGKTTEIGVLPKYFGLFCLKSYLIGCASGLFTSDNQQ